MSNRPLLQRPPLLVPSLLALAFAVLVGASAVAQDGYITLRNAHEVLILDPGALSVPGDLPSASTRLPVTGALSGVAVSPNGADIYVVVANTYVRHIRGGVLQADITASLNGGPEQIVVSPDGSKLFITNTATNRLHVIDLDSDNTLTNIDLVSASFGVDAVRTAGGDRVYVSLENDDQVNVFDADSNGLLATVVVGDRPQGVAASPRGDRVYVANNLDGSVSVIDTTSNAVFAIENVGANPQELTVSADGSRLYVTLKGDGDVAVVDTISNEVIDRVDLGVAGDSLHGISYSADEAFVVVAHFGTGKISVINPSDGNSFVTTPPILNSINRNARPRYVAFQPLEPPDDPPYFDPATFCDFTHAGEVGTPLTFNIIARDDNSLTLDVLGALPPGASMNPNLPFTTNSTANSTFVWTPGEGDAGTYDLTYTADDGVYPAVSCAVSIDVPEPPPPPGGDDVEFAAFNLRLASISTRGRFADSFWFNGNFTVDLENGGGIDPVEEDVTIAIEGIEFAIGAGGFRSYWGGRLFKYRGTIGGANLLIYITPRGRGDDGRYNINVSGWKGNFSGAENPLQMCVTVGDDFGCADRRGWIR